MNAFSLLVIRVFAAYLVFKSIGDVTPLLLSPGIWAEAGVFNAVALFAAFAVPFVTGIILWFVAPWLANRMTGQAETAVDLSASVIVSAGVFLIGLYWVMRALSVLLSQWATTSTVNYGWFLVFVLALVMVTGHAVFTRLFHMLQRAGRHG